MGTAGKAVDEWVTFASSVVTSVFLTAAIISSVAGGTVVFTSGGSPSDRATSHFGTGRAHPMEHVSHFIPTSPYHAEG